jgi:hypothetical protein
MGFTINAKCKNCFFRSKNIFVAYGGSGPNPNRVPAFDLKTNKLVTENYYDKEQLEGVVIFYNQPEMFTQNEITLPAFARVRNKLEKLFNMLFDRRAERRRKEQEAMDEEWKEMKGKKGEVEPIEWYHPILPRQRELIRLNRYNNKCPKCKKYAMIFEEGSISWD